MKYTLVLSLLSVCLMNLTKGDEAACLVSCGSTYAAEFGAAGTDVSKVCKAMQEYVTCIVSTCKIEVPSSVTQAITDALKALGATCDLPNSKPNSGSMALSASLLTLGSLLVAAYKISFL